MVAVETRQLQREAQTPGLRSAILPELFRQPFAKELFLARIVSDKVAWARRSEVVGLAEDLWTSLQNPDKMIEAPHLSSLLRTNSPFQNMTNGEWPIDNSLDQAAILFPAMFGQELGEPLVACAAQEGLLIAEYVRAQEEAAALSWQGIYPAEATLIKRRLLHNWHNYTQLLEGTNMESRIHDITHGQSLGYFLGTHKWDHRDIVRADFEEMVSQPHTQQEAVAIAEHADWAVRTDLLPLWYDLVRPFLRVDDSLPPAFKHRVLKEDMDYRQNIGNGNYFMYRFGPLGRFTVTQGVEPRGILQSVRIHPSLRRLPDRKKSTSPYNALGAQDLIPLLQAGYSVNTHIAPLIEQHGRQIRHDVLPAWNDLITKDGKIPKALFAFAPEKGVIMHTEAVRKGNDFHVYFFNKYDFRHIIFHHKPSNAMLRELKDRFSVRRDETQEHYRERQSLQRVAKAISLTHEGISRSQFIRVMDVTFQHGTFELGILRGGLAVRRGVDQNSQENMVNDDPVVYRGYHDIGSLLSNLQPTTNVLPLAHVSAQDIEAQVMQIVAINLQKGRRLGSRRNSLDDLTSELASSTPAIGWE